MTENSLKIIDSENRIASCNVEDIPGWMLKGKNQKECAFFYLKEMDYIVLNEDHANYKLYLPAVETFLKVDIEIFSKAISLFPDELENIRVKVIEAYAIVSAVKERRQMLRKVKVMKE